MVTRAGARATIFSNKDSKQEERADISASELPKAAAPAESSPGIISRDQMGAGAID